MTNQETGTGAARATAERGARRTLIMAVLFAGLMLGMAYAAVPLYQLFCQVTGFGGTPLRAESVESGDSDATLTASGAVDSLGYADYDAVGCPATATETAFDGAEPSDREIVVLFDANTDTGLPWEFEPMVSRMTVRVGEPQIMCYRAHNPTDRAVTGTATFNVEPETMGGYFVKIDCFCFQEQRLEPGQSVAMPVYFFVHDEILEDEAMTDQRTATLSYTFFRRDDLASTE